MPISCHFTSFPSTSIWRQSYGSNYFGLKCFEPVRFLLTLHLDNNTMNMYLIIYIPSVANSDQSNKKICLTRKCCICKINLVYLQVLANVKLWARPLFFHMMCCKFVDMKFIQSTLVPCVFNQFISKSNHSFVTNQVVVVKFKDSLMRDGPPSSCILNHWELVMKFTASWQVNIKVKNSMEKK